MYQEFQNYIGELAQTLSDGRDDHSFAASREAMRLELDEEEHRFLEWKRGEEALNTAIYSLVRNPDQYHLRSEAFGTDLVLATKKFEHLIRKQERSLRECHEKIDLLTSESDAHNLTAIEPQSGSVTEKVRKADEIAETGLKWAGRLIKFVPWAREILRTVGLP